MRICHLDIRNIIQSQNSYTLVHGIGGYLYVKLWLVTRATYGEAGGQKEASEG